MMPRKHEVKWLGGYVRQGKKGATYIIEKWIRGTHFHVSTRCHSERPALKQFELFELNPKAYCAGGPVARAPLVITPALVLEFHGWMLNTKRNSKKWCDDVARFLAAWTVDLNDKDLRDVSMHKDLKPALARRKSRKHRVEAIKSFYGWLRKEKGLLTHAEDPTLDMPVPQSRPAKDERKKVVDQARVLAVLPHLDEKTRDLLRLQTGTAWHIAECRRFSEKGEVVPVGLGPLGPLAKISVKHKSGRRHTTPLSRLEHVEAAERIRARGFVLDDSTLNYHMARACAAAGIERFCLGAMRHSVLTWAVEMGASPQQASEFAGHRSLSTTRDFYLDTAVPTVSVPVLRLVR